ncbi:MAG TPA: NUDIX hydrolase [Acidimicrobiales bacterium]|nr:NUDIX hydrolase [Acidimicrobiales bacterium]
MTRTLGPRGTAGYDPTRFPAFAVTVDVVIFSMAGGELQVLLVERGVSPFLGAWALPGGFKRPDETLDEAARRELVEETGLGEAGNLRQLGAYGDPERDPRMNVVTVAYLAVLPEVIDVIAGTDAAVAAWVRVSDVLEEEIELAFDHASIISDAASRVRIDLERTDLAIAFVGSTFTLAQLRAVYEAVWDARLGAANFRRRLVTESGWVVPTGRLAPPGSAGGKPAELYRAGARWRHGAPLRRPNEKGRKTR